MEPIIRSIRRYHGAFHAWCHGEPVVVVSVRRQIDGEDRIMRDDAEIDGLQPRDVIDFALLIFEDGGMRASWVTSDASPNELGNVEGRWDEKLETWIFVERPA